MSYERLADELIETQRSMLGQRAINVAQSVPGLLFDDGAVIEVDGGEDHDRTVIGTLVDEYVSIMGQSAHNRLDGVADEYADDLVLPENLGGPADLDDADTGSPDTATPDAAKPAAADGDTATAGGADGPASDSGGASAAEDGYEPADPDEVVTNIWGEEHESEDDSPDADPSDVDIESVYITVTDEVPRNELPTPPS